MELIPVDLMIRGDNSPALRFTAQTSTLKAFGALVGSEPSPHP
jgi:hypothetical protein